MSTKLEDGIDEWIYQFRFNFQRDLYAAEQEAERLRISFAEENNSDIQGYILKKQSLLIEAGISDSSIITRKL